MDEIEKAICRQMFLPALLFLLAAGDNLIFMKDSQLLALLFGYASPFKITSIRREVFSQFRVVVARPTDLPFLLKLVLVAVAAPQPFQQSVGHLPCHIQCTNDHSFNSSQFTV